MQKWFNISHTYSYTYVSEIMVQFLWTFCRLYQGCPLWWVSFSTAHGNTVQQNNKRRECGWWLCRWQWVSRLPYLFLPKPCVHRLMASCRMQVGRHTFKNEVILIKFTLIYHWYNLTQLLFNRYIKIYWMSRKLHYFNQCTFKY